MPADKFAAQFGVSWADALASGDVVNAMDACARLGCDADALDAQWGAAKKAKRLVKFGGGFYCGRVELDGQKPLYVFNGFFMSMRAKFTAPGTAIHYFSVEWDAERLPWSQFRARALGPTDPAEAPADALRAACARRLARALGLAACPDVGDNGVHASASPFEALAERMNWLQADVRSDAFGAACLAAGIDEPTLKAWSVDPQVQPPRRHARLPVRCGRGLGRRGALYPVLSIDGSARPPVGPGLPAPAAAPPPAASSFRQFPALTDMRGGGLRGAGSAREATGLRLDRGGNARGRAYDSSLAPRRRRRTRPRVQGRERGV